MLNTKLASALVIAASAFAAGGAMAQPVFAEQALTSDQAALLAKTNRQSPFVTAGGTAKARADVVAELQAARGNGQYAALESDSYAVFFTQAGTSGVSRVQVRNEASAARASGELDRLDSDSAFAFFPASKASKG